MNNNWWRLFPLWVCLIIGPGIPLAYSLIPCSSISLRLYSPSTNTQLQVFGGGGGGGNSNNRKAGAATDGLFTKLPKGISPFEKSKREDVQKELRNIAQQALIRSLIDGQTLLEMEFPPLLGGDNAKSQFDDFDNVQELDKNRDCCVELLPTLSSSSLDSLQNIWFILPDLKEVELCKAEWTGKRYQNAASFTCIEAVTEYYYNQKVRMNSVAAGTNEKKIQQVKQQQYSKPWGATFAGFVNQLVGSESSSGSLLGDQRALDTLLGTCSLHLVCQPGNGGPVEDWINVKAFHENANSIGNTTVPTCIVNGALDKVRDGYYAPCIFPNLAKTFDFYRSFEAVLFLKPISDKGVYGWVFRVYPEPWQVILQIPKRDKRDRLMIDEKVALVKDQRPSYQEAVQALLQAAAAAA